MKNIEVELKFRLPTPQSIITFVEQNATFIKEITQKDSYFAPSHDNQAKEIVSITSIGTIKME